MSVNRPKSALTVIAPILIVLILGLAVLFGIEESRNSAFNRMTPDQKVVYLTGDLRAPGDPSTVAVSNLGLAFQIRAEVTTDVQNGMSLSQILQAMENEYGPDVLAVPRFEGFGIAVWVAPLIVLFGILVAVVLFLRRTVLSRPVRRPVADASNSDVPESSDEWKDSIKSQLQDYL